MRKKPAQRRACNRQAADGEDDSSLDADGEDHCSCYQEDGESGAQIGLLNDQQHGRERQNKRRDEFFESYGFFFYAGAEISGQHENHRQAREFRRLKSKGAENKPAFRAVDHLPREEDGDEQNDDEGVKKIGPPRKNVVVEKEDEQQYA